MKKFKRIVALLLAGMLALSMLTGCGAGFQEDEFGEYIKGITLEAVDYVYNPDYDPDELLENNEELEKELAARLNKVARSGEMLPADQYERRRTGNGKPYEEIEVYELFPYDIYDVTPHNWLVYLSYRLGQDLMEYDDVTRSGSSEAEYIMTDFAVAYRVVYDSEGEQHLAFGIAYKGTRMPRAAE